GLGKVALAQGDEGGAAKLFAESLVLSWDHQDRRYLAHALAGLAGVAAMRGLEERAARLFGAAAALHEAIAVPVFSAQRAEFEREVANLRATLHPDVF